MIRKKIIIIGAGQLGTLLSEILDKNKYKLCGYIDNDQNKIGKKFCGITVLEMMNIYHLYHLKNFN